MLTFRYFFLAPEQKYADESSLDLFLERTVELHKDWSPQFNQVRIK